MTAPGKHLEFAAGPAFRRRVQPVPGLEDVIVGYLKKFPPHALDSHGVSAFELSVGGDVYGIVCRRQGQRVSLLGLFSLPEEAGAFGQRYRDWQALYKAA